MARGGSISTGNRGGPAYKVEVRIEGLERTSDEFKQARKQVNSRLRDAWVRVGERTVLPDVKAGMPDRWSSTLYVKRDRAGVFIGARLRGSMNRALGWWDFGGKRPNDHSRRVGPRVIVEALGRRSRDIEHEGLVEVMRAFDGLEHVP